MNNLGFASVAAVNQYLRFAGDQGLDCGHALSAAGIEAFVLQDLTGRITGAQFQTLLLDLIHQSTDPLLGLNSGDYVQPGSYNVLGYIVMSCSNLREAIERIAPFEKLVGDMGTTSLEPDVDDPESLIVRWHCTYPDPEVRPHMVDNVFASWVNYSRWLSNNDKVTPASVRLEKHRPDEPAQLERYQQIFRCPVVFSQPMNAIVIPQSLLELPLRQPDQSLRKTLEVHANEQIRSLAAEPTDLIQEIKHRIQQQLDQGITRQDMVAEALGITARTLQRRLSEQGYSYQQLLDEVRLESAGHLLKTTQIPLAELANQLGFSEPKSFHRWFKSRTDKTPGDFREQAKK